MAESLEALLDHSIDYAGLFPPAALPLDQVFANYEAYLRGPHTRFLNRLILRESIHRDGEWAPNGAIYREALDPVPGDFAKIRTGGLTPNNIPSVYSVAEFIRHQARAKRAFKATAGLHHPVRGTYALTVNVDRASDTIATGESVRYTLSSLACGTRTRDVFGRPIEPLVPRWEKSEIALDFATPLRAGPLPEVLLRIGNRL